MNMLAVDEAANSDAQSQPALNSRIEALKDVALSLLHEVQTLGEVQNTEVRRGINFYEEVRRFESDLIRRALVQTGGHQVRAARLLGLKVTTLNSIIKRYNIDPQSCSVDAVSSITTETGNADHPS